VPQGCEVVRQHLQYCCATGLQGVQPAAAALLVPQGCKAGRQRSTTIRVGATGLQEGAAAQYCCATGLQGAGSAVQLCHRAGRGAAALRYCCATGLRGGRGGAVLLCHRAARCAAEQYSYATVLQGGQQRSTVEPQGCKVGSSAVRAKAHRPALFAFLCPPVSKLTFAKALPEHSCP
jgi:hypothetical protein